MAQSAPIEINLALEGGGVLGIAEVGAVIALREAGYVVRNVAGTSAGAIVAAMVAANMDSETLKATVSAVDYKNFQKPVSWLGRLPVVGSVALWAGWAIGGKGGRYQQTYLTQLVDKNMGAMGCRTWGELQAKVEQGTAAQLKIVAFTPNSGDKIVFPDDYSARFGLDASTQPISFAVDSSTAIPTFFVPPQLSDAQGREWLFTDGGATDSYPYDIAHQMNPRLRTVGICIDWPRIYQEMPKAFRGPKLLLRELLTAGSATMQRLRERPNIAANTVVIGTLGIDSQNFNLESAQVAALYQAGYTAARQWAAKDLAQRAARQARRGHLGMDGQAA